MIKKIIYILQQCWHVLRAFLPWYVGLYRGKRWYTRTAVGIMSAVVGVFIYLGMVDINFLWLFGKSPGFFQIAKPPKYEASEVYSADSVLIGRYYKENRTPVRYEEVDSTFWNALVDTEDERFYKHFGIDPLGLGGAVKDAVVHGDARGASTITQQLAKNLFRVRSQYSTGLLGKIPGIRMLVMKSKEWIIAVKLESIYTKKAILAMYANTVDFGNNSYGIKTAAKTYFNTTPDKLTAEQSAVLVGMLKATTSYNPITHPENAKKRRNQVLANMVAKGDLSQADCDLMSAKPIKLDVNKTENYNGKCQYFREAVAKYLEEWAKDNDLDLYTSGLRIYTTIDTKMQHYAELAVTRQMRQVQRNFRNHWGDQDPWRDENGNVVPGFIDTHLRVLPFYKALQEKYPNQPDSVHYYAYEYKHRVKLFDYEKGAIYETMTSADSLRYMLKFMHASMLAMEPQTGAVKAWVGDVNFNTWMHDNVITRHQPGSTFKLFVYTEAMNQGLTPCDKRRDEYISMQVEDRRTHQTVTWAPTNANGRFSGDSIPLKTAFARSINSVAVRLGQEAGIRHIIKTAENMGINSATAQQMGINTRLDDEPSLALGSSDVTLLEMVTSYCTVANNGKFHEPVLVTKVIDSDGNVVFEGPEDTSTVLTEKVAFFMQQLLKAGTQEGGGTSLALNQYVDGTGTDWGGKTGTTNQHSDGWFMGVSPNLVVGAWVGGEYPTIHFRTGSLGQGSRTALPIVGLFLQKVMRDADYRRYRGRWQKPEGLDADPSAYECDAYNIVHEEEEVPDSVSYDEEGIDAEAILREFQDHVGGIIEGHDGRKPESQEPEGQQPSAQPPTDETNQNP